MCTIQNDSLLESSSFFALLSSSIFDFFHINISFRHQAIKSLEYVSKLVNQFFYAARLINFIGFFDYFLFDFLCKFLSRYGFNVNFFAFFFNILWNTISYKFSVKVALFFARINNRIHT